MEIEVAMEMEKPGNQVIMDSDESEIRIKFVGRRHARNCVNESATVCRQNLYYFVIKWLVKKLSSPNEDSGPLVWSLLYAQETRKHKNDLEGDDVCKDTDADDDDDDNSGKENCVDSI